MAVPEQTPYIEHTGNGVTTSFSLKFQCESKDHLIVLVDEIEPPIATWSLTGGNVVFTTAPAAGKKITLQRNTPFSRATDYQSYNNSFRPPAVNKDFDWIWWKLQELGVADWIFGARIDALKNYVDRKDDELKAYLMEEIRKQGVALDQLDDYYNYLMQRLAQIAVDKGWDASFVVDGNENQHQINNSLIRTYNSVSDLLSIPNPRHGQVAFVRHYDLEQGILDGGGIFVYQNTNQLTNDGGYIFKGWTRKLERPIFTPEMFGAKGDLSKDDAPNIQSCTNSARTNKIKCIQFHNKYLIDSARIAGQETLLEMIPSCSFLGFGDAELVVGESIPDKFHILSAVNYITTASDVGNVLVDGLKMRGLTANTTNMGVYSSNIAIHTFGLNNVCIQRCTFDDLDLSQVIVSGVRYDGVDYGSKVTVQNNKILSVVAENSVNMDHSSIYMEAPNSFVTNNLFDSKTLQCKKVACAVEVHAPNVLTKGNQIYGYSRAGWLASAPIDVYNSNFIDNIAHVSNHLIIVTTTDTARVSKCRISGNKVRCEHATSEANFVTYQGLLVTSGEFDLGVNEIVVDNNLLNIDYSVNPVFATIANLDQELSALFHDNIIFGAVGGLNALNLDSGGFTKNKVYNHITSAALNKDFFINIGGTSLNSADLSSNEFKFNAATKPSYLIGLINMTGDSLVSTAISGNKYLSTQKPQADVYFQPTLNIGGNANVLDIMTFSRSVNIPSLTAGQEHAWTQSLPNNFNNCIVDVELLPEGSFYPLVNKGVASGSNLDMRVKAISTTAAFSVSGVNMRVRTR